MSQWTSERAILRDLSRAQGSTRAPPRRPERPPPPRPRLRPLSAAERPPRAAAHQETEEELFSGCVSSGAGGGPQPQRPDLYLIRHMLDMVREQNDSEDDHDVTDVAVISKLNPASPHEFIPTKKLPPESSIPVKNGKIKKIRQRNIALESILQSLERQNQTTDTDVSDAPLKLLKPEDLIPNSSEGMRPSPAHLLDHGDVDPSKFSSEDTLVEKVKTWLTTVKSPIREEPVRVILETTNMFKKKSKPIASTHGTGLKKDTTDERPTRSQSDRTYTPSSSADDYYKKYQDKSQLMDSIQDDIWTKAEKKMNEIDEKRRIAEKRAAVDTLTAGAEPEPRLHPARSEPESDSHSAGAQPELDSHTADHELTDQDEIKAGSSSRALSGWAAVRLPRARHNMSGGAGWEGDGEGGCVVCAALQRWHAGAPRRHDTDPRPDQTRHDTDPRPDQTRHDTDPRPDQTRHDTDPRPDQTRHDTDPRPDQTRHDTDPRPDQTRHDTETTRSTPEWILKDAAGLFD